MTDKTIVLTTWPDLPGAEALAETLIERKLAACVNLLPAMTSIYSWQGRLERGSEHQLVIKTRQSLWDDIVAVISERHPYELPEILAIPVTAGLPGYLSWIDETTDAHH